MIFMEDDFLLKDDILKQSQLDFHPPYRFLRILV